MRRGNTPWTDEEEAILKAEWMKGTLARVISGMLVDRSKSAVVGRAHKLDLPRRQGDVNRPRPAKYVPVVQERVYSGDSWSARLFESWADRKARLARERASA